jgi:hypothetical protein
MLAVLGGLADVERDPIPTRTAAATKSLAIEYAKADTRVNAVAPSRTRASS